MNFYQKYKNNVHSQNGEDGLLEELFKRLNITTGWVVEIGAHDGVYCSNTFNLVKKGFNAVYIEGSERFEQLVELTKEYPKIIPLKEYVNLEDNKLDDILSRTNIPLDFEVCSIDIDSFDYFVWKSLIKYNPKVVIIEIKSDIPADEVWIHLDNSHSKTSFKPMLELGISKGYTLLCHTGNLVFVRNDYAKLIPDIFEDPNKLFLTKWLK